MDGAEEDATGDGVPIEEPSAGSRGRRATTDNETAAELLIVIPIFNDWASAAVLLRRLADVTRSAALDASFLLVDDGSTAPLPEEFGHEDFDVLSRTSVLSLRRNLGHQRAIAVALAYVQARRDNPMTIVMDGDGEDDPADVPRLVAKFRETGGTRIVFAERRVRSESALFILFYHFYRVVHVILTGHGVRVGNFSIIPRASLDKLVVVGELWNHYAASVFRARLPRASIPVKRATRIAGHSQMDFVSLVVHGLSAISVYSDLVGVRVLATTSVLIAITLTTVAAVVGIRLFTDLAIPGWATVTVGLLLVMLTQAVTISLIFILMMLSGRQSSTFLPIRDYAYFVAGVRSLAAKG
jgi:hypothetical protein